MTGRVIVVGDIVTDVIAVLDALIVVGSDTPAQIAMTGGGAGANIAAWLVDAGVPVTLCGVVGDDSAGADRMAELTAAGVNCVVRRSAEAPTGSIVVLSRGAERTMITDRGANNVLVGADVDAAFAAAGDAVHLHVSGYSLLETGSADAARHAVDLAVARGLTVSVDAASAAPLRQVGGLAFLAQVRHADVLFANADEAGALLGDGTEDVGPRLAAEYAAALATRLGGRAAVGGIVVVKLGRDGAIAATSRGSVVRVPAEATEAADVTGAGDAFAAGFLTAWLGGADVGDALGAGSVLGARAVTAVGGRPTG